MLSFNEKVIIFNNLLGEKELSYADSFNADISIASENCEYIFLNELKSIESIRYWIEKFKNRIVMKEDDYLLEDIIDDYIELG